MNRFQCTSFESKLGRCLRRGQSLGGNASYLTLTVRKIKLWLCSLLQTEHKCVCKWFIIAILNWMEMPRIIIFIIEFLQPQNRTTEKEYEKSWIKIGKNISVIKFPAIFLHTFCVVENVSQPTHKDEKMLQLQKCMIIIYSVHKWWYHHSNWFWTRWMLSRKNIARNDKIYDFTWNFVDCWWINSRNFIRDAMYDNMTITSKRETKISF